jgi:hypothetical protein
MFDLTMETITTQIAYLGPALNEGIMDVRDLAPALIGLSDYVQDANRVLYGDGNKVEVQVHSNFERGSFIVTISILHTPIQAFVQLFSNPAASALANLLGHLGLIPLATGYSLIGLIKALKGKLIKPAEGDKTKVEIVIDGKKVTIEIDNDLLKLYNSPTVREAARRMLEPLRREGFDEFQTRHNEKPVESVAADEIGYFDFKPEGDSPLTQDRQVVLEIVKPSFRRHLAWNLAEGESDFSAHIEDPDFWSDVDKRTDLFGAGDSLRATLHEEVQKKQEGGFRVQRTITKVLGVIRPEKPSQRPLFDVPKTDEPEKTPKDSGPLTKPNRSRQVRWLQ